MDYELFMKALEDFIMTEDIAIWEGRVQPLLTKVVQSGAYGTCRNAILRETGMFLTDVAGKDVMITAVELQALRSAKTMAARAVIRKEILASIGWIAPPVFMVLCVFTTTKDAYALGRVISPDNQKAYLNYMNQYLQYIVRTLQMKRSILRYRPPMSYDKWLNKGQNTAWWQES